MDIVDKTILYGLCYALFSEEGGGGHEMMVLLLTLLIALVNSYFEQKPVGFISGILFAVCMAVEPYFVFFFPVMAYDLWDTKNGILLFLESVLTFAMLWGSPNFVFVAMVFLIALACLLCHKTTQGERLTHLVRHIRDNEQEKNLLLADRNRHLIEKQDQEIYVATLRERNRIAREIHDNVGHILTRTILQMGALMTIHKKDEVLTGQLNSVKENLDMALNNVRESVHDLHDESIDLEQALREATSALEGKFACDISYDVSEQLPRAYKYAIIGVVKEAVSNILKYSENNQVEIMLREHPGMYQLSIRDYENPDAVVEASERVARRGTAAAGMGLQNIRDRVEGLNGNVTITKGAEFKIFVTLPKNNTI